MELDECIEFMKEKHKGQKRIQGTPYYLHPLEVGNLLKRKGFSIQYQITGIFHDLVEDTDATYKEIAELSNDEVAEAVRLLTKEEGYNIKEYMKRIANSDIAKMAKLADRFHNLSEAHLAPERFQEKYIKETEEWFMELAKGTVFEKDIKDVLVSLKQSMYER